MPLSWVFILMVLAIIIPKFRKKGLITAFVIFYLFSNSAFFQLFLKHYEYPVSEISMLKGEPYDAAIILGGFTVYAAPGEPVNFSDGVDRMTGILPAYHQGKVKYLFFAGGSGSILDTLETEADLAINYLKSISYPDSVLLKETKSRNTHENALYSKQTLDSLFSNGSFLLVTSAVHMPRAIACFNKVGLEVTPFAVDPLLHTRSKGFDYYFLPNSSAIRHWEQLLNEWFGFVIYKIKGYV
jgi:uncharacterized SAM-binding protein YcdF (DUF218 family)